MKNVSNYWTIVLTLCFSLCAIGNDLFARPEQRPYFVQKHAPKKNRYYYYPRQNVYYDPIENVYFVWESSYWKPVSNLPGRYVSVTYSNTPRFELWMTSTHPYYYNTEHRKTYHEYRVVKPKPAPRVHVESRPKPNVSFHLEINPPRPVYVEERVVIVEEHHHDHGYHGRGHGPGRGHGHGH
nr:hypothetical protein [uncultured Fluviicola sp.]